MNRVLHKLLPRIVRRGELEITWADGTVSRYGPGDGFSAKLRFFDSAAEWRLVVNPELALGELYMNGRIDFPGDSLLEFLELAADNHHWLRNVGIVAAAAHLRFATRRLAQNNTFRRARRNVAHHYDLDERLYRLFLDSDMQYSCAYFETSDVSLDEAQAAKKRHIAAKLALSPGQDVLDIGSGWGGLGLFLAEEAGVNVTGVTLSREQHRVSNDRASALGLRNRARFELQDYRALDRKFDRIVSVGMFEHVGAARYREFFEKAAALLKPDGVMLLHSIGRSGPPGTTNPWIAKYIFPGGYIPALSEVLPAVENAGLIVTDIEILRLHYAETLKAWRARFRARWQEAARIYDERFCRMWDFYLAGSEAAFRAGGMVNFQMQIVRDQHALPVTRNYMAAAEARFLAGRDPPESLRLAGE
jgi:cyclopropane-fatty-acyl-phospholipid synthase